MNPTLFPSSILLLIGGVGLFFLFGGAWMMWGAEDAAGWPTVNGVVQRARVERQVRATTRVGPVPIIDQPSGYKVVIEYAYEIQGRTYVSDRWSFSGGLIFPDEESAEAKARRYREATPVVVHYDPADPATSVLKPGDTKTGLWRALWGAALIAYALYGYLNQ